MALKRIRPDKLDALARRRFLREAAITGRLQHPGIVPIYGLGQDDDGPFYTMPLIEGQTLQAASTRFITMIRSAAIRAGGAYGSAGCSSSSSPSATRWPTPTTRGLCTAT